MILHSTVVPALISLFLVLSAPRQAADDIVNGYVEAIGGRNALDSIQTLRIVRDYEQIEQNRVQRGTYYFKRPDLYRYEAGSGLVCIVMSGGRAWRRSRQTAGSSWQPWEEIRHGRRYILDWLGPFLDHTARGITLEFAGRESVDGVLVFHLRMTGPNGNSSDVYFDTESNLYVRATNSVILDYRPVGTVLFPFRKDGTAALPDGGELHYRSTLVDVQINIPLEDSFFAPTPVDGRLQVGNLVRAPEPTGASSESPPVGGA